MFLFRADRILAELGAHAPAILQAVEEAFAALREVARGAFEVPEALYAAVPEGSIDNAVMERAKRIVVVLCDPGWSDLGSWQALWEHLPKDRAGNAVLVSDRRDTDAGKRLVALLQKGGRTEATTHTEAQRPWDGCRVLQHGPGFEVREIVVAPGARLTRQSHEQPTERWVVVAGTAKSA